jgi:hypothetical protein
MKYVNEPSRLGPLQEHRADLVVRPDHVQLHFQLSIEAPQPDKGPPLLEGACEVLRRRACEATGADVRLRLRDLRFSHPEPKKLRLPEDEERALVSVDGALELPLAPALTFWERGTKVAALVRVCREQELDARDVKSRPQPRFGAPVPRVAQPEEHRAELLRRLGARLREFHATLAPTEVPLRLAECIPPGPVDQEPVSLEEVALSLRVAWQASGTRDGTAHLLAG